MSVTQTKSGGRRCLKVIQDYLVERLRSTHPSLSPLLTALSSRERLVRVCAEIVAELVSAHDEGKDVNLNGLKARVSRKHKCPVQPKLMDIIAAIPEAYKAALLPRIRAKPIRTASGVRSSFSPCTKMLQCIKSLLFSSLSYTYTTSSLPLLHPG